MPIKTTVRDVRPVICYIQTTGRLTASTPCHVGRTLQAPCDDRCAVKTHFEADLQLHTLQYKQYMAYAAHPRGGGEAPGPPPPPLHPWGASWQLCRGGHLCSGHMDPMGQAVQGFYLIGSGVLKPVQYQPRRIGAHGQRFGVESWLPSTTDRPCVVPAMCSACYV